MLGDDAADPDAAVGRQRRQVFQIDVAHDAPRKSGVFSRLTIRRRVIPALYEHRSRLFRWRIGARERP